MQKRYDVVVVGGGIVGLAHAIAAHERGRSVLLLERDGVCRSASVRNFGMIWPVGQRQGEDEDGALRSRDKWIELSREAGFALETCGSLHLVHHEDEEQVVCEFLERQDPALGRAWLGREEVLARSPAASPLELRGALWSPLECCVDPREAIAKLTEWAARLQGVEVRADSVVEVTDEGVRTAAGARVDASWVIVCSGAETRTLFPEVHANAPLVPCKLQMLRTAPQPRGWRLGPMLASGLTLRHYPAFEDCPTLPKLRARYAREHPELDEFGIHVLASQNASGEIVLGDSHEYGGPFAPGSSEEIDEVVLRWVRSRFRLLDEATAARWTGVYLKRRDGGTGLVLAPREHVRVVTGMGGAGMTRSFALGEDVLDELAQSA